MSFHYPLTDGKADTGPLVLPFCMQALEDLEDPFGIFRVDTNTVIGYREDPFVTGLVHRSRDLRYNTRPLELEGITDQVLEERVIWVPSA